MLKIQKVITISKLDINALIRYFKNIIVFETLNIVALYRPTQSNVKPTFINWHLHTIIHIGILQHISSIKCTLGNDKNDDSQISLATKDIFTKEYQKFIFKFCNINKIKTLYLGGFRINKEDSSQFVKIHSNLQHP